MRDEAPFSMRVALAMFLNNGEMSKNNKADLMNETSTIMIDVLIESAFHAIDRCTWLYHIYCPKVGNIKNLHSSFKKNYFNYTGKSTEVPEQKRTKKNFTEHEKNFSQQQQQAEID